MSVYVEWRDPRTKDLCRIRFNLSTNMQATHTIKQKLWESKIVGFTKLKILDPAYCHMPKHSKKPSKFNTKSTVYVDSMITTPEIIEAIKEFMREIYQAKDESLMVQVSLYESA